MKQKTNPLYEDPIFKISPFEISPFIKYPPNRKENNHMEEKTSMEIPCDSCIHNRVCRVQSCFEETKVNTTHPYIKVILKCTEFYEKPNAHIKSYNPFENEI